MVTNPIQNRELPLQSGFLDHAKIPYVTRRCTLRERRLVTLPAAATPARRTASPITISARPISQRNGDVDPGMTRGMPRKRSGSQPRCRNRTAPIRAEVDASVALTRFGSAVIWPRREQCAPLIGDGDRLSVGRNGHVDDRRVAHDHISLIPHYLTYDEARIADGCESSANAQVVAGESLRLIRCFDLSHHRPQARPHVLVVRHVPLEGGPAGTLEKRQQMRVIHMADGITITRIDMDLEVFCHLDRGGLSDES